MTDALKTLLGEKGWLMADGATGTNLFARGLEQGDAPELWNLHRPDDVKAHYRDFVNAGSDIVLTNTFGGTANRLRLHQADGQVREINRAAASLLREVADEADRKVLVAGSMGPTGDLFVPLGPLTEEEGEAAFAAQAQALAEGGADLLWIETISSVEEIRAAEAGAATAGLPIVATLSFDTNGRTMMGVTPEEWAKLAHELAVPLAAYGANCGTGPAELLATVLGLRAAAQPDDVIVAKANCGIPQWIDGAISYSGTPELMADYARLARDSGAAVIGGCCGTTPGHLVHLRSALAAHVPGEAPSIETIAATLGQLSNATLKLFDAAEAPEGGAANDEGGRRRRGRRRQAASAPF